MMENREIDLKRDKELEENILGCLLNDSKGLENGAVAILSNGRKPITKKIPILQVKDPRKAMSQISAQFYGNPSEKINIIGKGISFRVFVGPFEDKEKKDAVKKILAANSIDFVTIEQKTENKSM